MKNLFYNLLTLLLLSVPALAEVQTANVRVSDRYLAPQLQVLGAMIDMQNGEEYYVSEVISVLPPADLDKSCVYKINYTLDQNKAFKAIRLVPPMEKLDCGHEFPRTRSALLENADRNESLTPIDRSRCAMYPQVTPFAAAKPGLHYDSKQEKECDAGWNCSTWSKLATDYRYTVITVTDYYNDAGKIVTTKTDKSLQSMNSSGIELSEGHWQSTVAGDAPVDAAALAQLTRLYSKSTDDIILNIQRYIYKGIGDVCPNSYYK